MNCVGSALPFQSTVEALLKPSPLTITVVAALPGGEAEGVIQVTTGAGLATVNVAGAPAAGSTGRTPCLSPCFCPSPTRPSRGTLDVGQVPANLATRTGHSLHV